MSREELPWIKQDPMESPLPETLPSHHHLSSRLEFVVLSFEGPDLYSMVGGLGVRVTEMTKALAAMGFSVHLFFVGDPSKESSEVACEGRLILRRWSAEVSRRYPRNVYEGELAKVEDYQKTLPRVVIDDVVAPNAARGKLTVILAEDWQTAPAIRLAAVLAKERGLSQHGIFLWNANNTFGFSTIDWQALTAHVHLLTVSRYMRERMKRLSLAPLVVHNGVPSRYWTSVDEETGLALRRLFPGLLLAKVGRYHPDKCWLMAMDAVAQCRDLGMNPKLIVRGGTEDYGEEVRAQARRSGLSWAKVQPQDLKVESILEALLAQAHHDVLELDFFVPEYFLRSLYWASRAVLANSGHEPFGLVGLEVMACGGVAFTGSTGEEYVQSFRNAIALGSEDPREIVAYLRELLRDPDLESSIRRRARQTAQGFGWPDALRDFLCKVEFVAELCGLGWSASRLQLDL